MRSVNRIATSWRKSSHSAACGDCVAVGHLVNGHIGVRDTKDAAELILPFSPASWRAFIGEVKQDRLNRA
jgi:Domain of unknown function (DUF397)